MARGARWHVIVGEIPLKIASISGEIYQGYTSTLTINIDPDTVVKSKATAANVLFWVGGSLIHTQSNVALPQTGALTFKTEAPVFNQAYDTVVDMTVQNSETLTDGKGGVNRKVWRMPYGGNKTENASHIFHKFTSTGDFVNTLPNLGIEYLVASGGGGGSGELGAGGGGGGAVSTSATLAQDTTYRATIGGGGGGGRNSRPGTYGGNGGKSSFNGTAPTGGGAGGYRYAGGKGGGSGGGCGADLVSGGAGGTSGQGNAGGRVGHRHDPYQGGGGGGKGGAGKEGTLSQGAMRWPDGGVGISWHGGNYAGGGGGAGPLRASGTANNSYYGRGWGGAGNGCKETVIASHAGANTAGGGGGGSNSYVGYNQKTIGPGSNGGSGVVVLRYAKPV